MERITYTELPESILLSMRQVQTVIDNSGLDPKLLELMRTRVSQLNGCAFCLDMHYKEAVHAGEDPLRLISISAWRETPYYSDAEQAVLAFAERLTRLPENENNDDIHDELNNHFSKVEIGYLTLAVIQINSWNRIVKSFGRVPGKYRVGSLK